MNEISEHFETRRRELLSHLDSRITSFIVKRFKFSYFSYVIFSFTSVMLVGNYLTNADIDVEMMNGCCLFFFIFVLPVNWISEWHTWGKICIPSITAAIWIKNYTFINLILLILSIILFFIDDITPLLVVYSMFIPFSNYHLSILVANEDYPVVLSPNNVTLVDLRNDLEEIMRVDLIPKSNIKEFEIKLNQIESETKEKNLVNIELNQKIKTLSAELAELKSKNAIVNHNVNINISDSVVFESTFDNSVNQKI